jgi:hypothetical protein
VTPKLSTCWAFPFLATGLFFKVYRLLRFTKKKLSRALRKWFVYLAIAGVAGNSSRVFDHLSLWKPWRLAKGVAAYLIAF